MSERQPRWKAEETKDTAFEMSNLLVENWQDLDTVFDNGTKVIDNLRAKGRELESLIAQVAAGSALPNEKDVEEAMTMAVSAISGVRDGIRRKFSPQDEAGGVIRGAFGIGETYRRDDAGSVLGMLNQVLQALDTHKVAADALKMKQDKLDKLTAYQRVLAKAEEANPRAKGRQKDPNVAKRNQAQIEVEEQVDDILTLVGSNCWDKPELLVTLKDSLPSRPYRNTKAPDGNEEGEAPSVG
ncbi:MAG: hypothetical protein EP343_27645 [Deltaproteobacteria bacterium]|nr:MAG: hypothetical protein EP343_27645 [Deltaproteobacteria bacterium]